VPSEPTVTREDLPATDAPTTRRAYLIFATVAVALFMSSVDQTIVATALPTIDHDLHSRLNWTAWIITIYALGRIMVVPLVGRLGERLGRRSIFVAAVSVFTVSSLLCGLATNIGLLIVLRGLQALGGGAFIPSATGLVADHFGPNRDRAVGLFTSIVPMGAIVGPILGGVFVTYWTWRGIFFINVPIGIVLIIAALRLIPSGDAVPGTRMDLSGSALLCIALLSATLAVTYLGDAGHVATSPIFIGLVVVAVAATAVLLARAGRPGAILPLRFLRGRGFGVMNLINFFYGGAALGFSALVPLYAQNRYGMNSLAAGTLLTARAVGMITVSGLATFALRRTGYRAPMVVGFSLSAAGLILLAISVPGHLSPHLWLSVTSLVVGIGIGLASPASNNATLELDPTQIASIAGIRVTFRQLGSITAVSVTSALLSRSADPGITQAHVFVVFAIMLLCIVPLVRLVPNHRAGW
jgi:EmrB/QacA subfamily drug resistance transporter